MKTIVQGERTMIQMRVKQILIAALSLLLLAGHLTADDEKLEEIQVGTPERIEVFPPTLKLNGVREKMQFVVTGYYADGTIQDLTRVAQFQTSNADVVAIESTVAKPKGDGSA